MLKRLFCKEMILCLIPCFAICLFLSGCTEKSTQIATQTPKAEQKEKVIMNDPTTPIFACNPGALTKDQRERYSGLTKKLIAEKKSVNELSDGYSLQYAAKIDSIKDVAEFITYERLCCPFLNFEMAVEGENLSLRMKGQEGVKAFIKEEFGI